MPAISASFGFNIRITAPDAIGDALIRISGRKPRRRALAVRDTVSGDTLECSALIQLMSDLAKQPLEFDDPSRVQGRA
jgi:hypothetical protein